MKLSNEEVTRYSRHLTLPEVGMQGQLKLKVAKVLICLLYTSDAADE